MHSMTARKKPDGSSQRSTKTKSQIGTSATNASDTGTHTDKVYRVVVECHVQVKARGENHARELAEIAVRRACESHPLLYADSPFVFTEELTRNSFLAGKPKRVVNV